MSYITDVLRLSQVIEEGAAGVLVAHDVQRPNGGVDHQAWLMFGRVDFPDFFQADALVVGIGLAVEVEALDQLLADVTAATFGERRAAQFHAGVYRPSLG